MDKLARVQDMAFNRLFKWLQTEIRSFTADIPETSTFFKMGMRTLRKRAILFQYVYAFACCQPLTELQILS